MIYDFRKEQIGNSKHKRACQTLSIETDDLDVANSLLKFLRK